MQPQKNQKFPKDFFVTLTKEHPKRKMHALAPIITTNKKKIASALLPEDTTPYFKPLSKYSSCSNILKIYDTPILPPKKKILPISDTRKVVLPSLKPKLHLKKEKHSNWISTMAFDVIHKKLFSDNQSTDLGVTFSRNSISNSRESLHSNIFTHK